MIYRRLDNNGDFTFGRGDGNFLKNNPEAVAQAVRTRLGLFSGEWFLNTTVGTPYSSQILGAGTISKYDFAIKDVISKTTGVRSIVDYKSNVSRVTRKATVSCTIDTIYGQATIQASI